MMGKYIKKIAARFSNDETGMALIIVLVLLLLGGITIVPVLAQINDALKSGVQYENKSKELYTADSGVEDGLWRIKYDSMGPGYDAYNYRDTFPYETELINGLTANVTIRNVWFPSNYNPPPLPADARDIIESEKLVVTGTATASNINPYSVSIKFTPDPGDNLTVKSLGVWLPQGFDYISGNCSLIGGPFDEWTPDYIDWDVDAPGGSTVVWGYYPPYPCFTDFPDVDSEATPMTFDFTFGYTPPAANPTALPTAIAWITTDMTQGEFGFTNPNDVPLSWDVDTRYYEILSNVDDTYIQAFTSKCALRQMGDAMSGDYVAIGGSLLSDDNGDGMGIREAWHTPSSFNLNTVPEDADVIAAYLYWAGWRNEASKATLLEDSCSNIDTYWSYSSPTGWEEDSNEYKGHYYGDGNDSRLLTLKNDMDLSSYAPGSIIVTWEQGSEVNAVIFADSCDNFDNWDNGGAWAAIGSFRGHSTAADSSSTRWLTLKDGEADLSGYSAGEAFISWDRWEEDNLDNGDSLWYAFSSDNGSHWSPYTRVFRNDFSGVVHDSIEIPSAYLTNGFKARLMFYGFSDWNDNLYLDNIEISGTGSLDSSDGLDFAFSGDDGASWSNYVEAFRGDQGSFMREFVYVVPDEYTTSDFKFRFKVVGCEESGEKVCVDNLNIINLPVDTEITFKIDGEQVYFYGSDPASGPSPLTSGRSYVMLNTMWGAPEGFSYMCTRDVTAIVKKYPIDLGEENHPGNAVYTVDGVSADANNNFSFAGWSLIVVYASPDTAGHYIYIRDDNFAFHPGDDEFLSLDFDDDGNPGGDITNFIVPEPITDQYGIVIETVAAKVTCFVAEGDGFGTSSIEITGQQSGLTKELWNPSSPDPDVWNGESYPGTYQEGVDIDTFELLWADNILTPDDTVLHVDMFSYNDAWNLVYFIISVRSETTTGGTSHYVIYG